jgi:tRNA pseudouridine55 synthase
LDSTKDTLELEVFCSKGTYIRTLAEDIGETIGCGATVKELRRIQSGQFSIAQALTLEQLQELDDQSRMETLIATDYPLLSLPAVQLNDQQAIAIKYGQAIDMAENTPGSVRMYGPSTFLGLGEIRLDGKLLPKKLFNLSD